MSRYRNPFMTPLWATLALAVTVSFAVDIPFRTLWGMTAWIPWLIAVGLVIGWERGRGL